MMADYKIYFNNTYLLISADRGQINNNFANVLDTDEKVSSFLNHPDVLFDGKLNSPLLIISADTEKILQSFRNKFQLVIAGGGIVFNEKGELLMIFRRGFWDLPKGKIEKKENILDGAIREVTEETGVTIQSSETKPTVTYHAYVMKGKQSLKHTEWYVMQATPGQSNLTPQTEEDIDEVKWVAKKNLNKYKAISYPLIWDLIAPYATA